MADPRMTKKAAALLESVRTEAAFRYTPDHAVPQPDRPIPRAGEPDTRGWWARAHDGMFGAAVDVRPQWSSSNAHGSLERSGSRSAQSSQKGVALYSNKVDAMRAARADLERRMAKRLRAVDLAIEQAIAEEADT